MDQIADGKMNQVQCWGHPYGPPDCPEAPGAAPPQ
jgi:hypothetical protein